ncbi:hypothetical protein AAG906_022709 [Vitis piasezkii]
MNDSLGLLAPDFGYKSQSKSAPMSSSKPSSRGPTRSPWNAAPDDLIRSSPLSSDGRGAPSSSINFDSILVGHPVGAKATSLPVYDKPIYDYDIFDGVPGLNTSGSVNYDVFSTVRDRSRSKTMRLMIFLGFWEEGSESKRSGNVEDVGSGFDDLLQGLVGLVFQVIGIDFYVGLFCPNLDTASIKLLVLKSDLCLLLYVLGQFSIGLISEAH